MNKLNSVITALTLLTASSASAESYTVKCRNDVDGDSASSLQTAIVELIQSNMRAGYPKVVTTLATAGEYKFETMVCVTSAK